MAQRMPGAKGVRFFVDLHQSYEIGVLAGFCWRWRPIPKNFLKISKGMARILMRIG